MNKIQILDGGTFSIYETNDEDRKPLILNIQSFDWGEMVNVDLEFALDKDNLNEIIEMLTVMKGKIE